MSNLKLEKRIRRHRRVRGKINGTATRPRLSIFRSNRHIWAQLIDDTAGLTVASASDWELKKKKAAGKRKVGAESVGELVASRALEKKIDRAVFDRGGYKYHGIVKAVAEGARKGGLHF